MSTQPSTPTTRAPGKRLTREMIDEILAGDPVLREDVERRLASQITQPTGETAAAMAQSLVTLQEMADGIAAKQDTLHTARTALIELSEKTLKPITSATRGGGSLKRATTPEEFALHLEVLRTLRNVLRPAHKALTEQFDTKLLPLAVRSANSSLKQTAMREMAEAYGVGRQQMYKLATKGPEGRGRRPKVSTATPDLPDVTMTREQFQDTVDTIADLQSDITELLADSSGHVGIDLAPVVEMLKQMGEHLVDAQAAVHSSRTTLLDLAATTLAPITYPGTETGEDEQGDRTAATADEYDVHLRIVRILSHVLRPELNRLTEQIEGDFQGFAVLAVVSAVSNSAVAKVADAYGAARQNVLRLVNAVHPGFLGGLRFKNTG